MSMEKDFQIDKMRLDEEWLNQPKLYFKYAKAHADARRKVDEAKNKLKVMEAEADSAVRSDPAQYGLAKVTDTAVKAVITSLPALARAEEELLALQHEVKVMEAATWALEHKKKSLENLVQLHLADYYSEPQTKNPSSKSDDNDTAEAARRALRRRGKRRQTKD